MTRGRPKKPIVKTNVPPENGVYYTVREAVDLLGLHRRTIEARLRDGTIKGKLIGCTWRIYKDELYTPET